MARLTVVIAGVAAFVLPKEKCDPGIVLLPRTTRRHSSDGEEIPFHSASLMFRPRRVRIPNKPELHWQRERAIWKLEGEDVRFVFDGDSENLKILNREGFVEMAEVLGSEKLSKIKEGCLGDNPGEECRLNGAPILYGRVFLKGGVVRPVEVKGEDVTENPREELWGFKSLQDPDNESDFLGRVFNGVLFTAEFRDVSDLRLHIGDVRIPLFPEPEPQEAIEVLEEGEQEDRQRNGARLGDRMPEDGSYDEEEFLVLVNNLPNLQHDGDGKGVEFFDRHFEIFYDLLEHSVEPLVPFLKVGKLSGGTNPPGSRCIPSAASA